MHGKNEVRPLEFGDGSNLQVAEIFYTIQGEGPYYGCPAIFIRLTGCNLRCHFCDTKWDDANDPRMNVIDLVQCCINFRELHNKVPLVVLTGGEPCRQNLKQLVDMLVERDFVVQVETAGTYWQECLSKVHLVCSPKTKYVHRLITEHCDDWKYVIRKGEVAGHDGLPAYPTQVLDPLVILNKPVETLQEFTLALDELAPYQEKYGDPARPPDRPGVCIWLSPCDEGDVTKTQENIELVGKLCLEFGYRAQVQLHKLLRLP